MFMDFVAPFLFAVLAWWLGTGVILYLDGKPRRSYRKSMIVATILACIAVVGITLTTEVHSTSAAYVSFSCGLMIWAWLEMAFLMGFVTGPRRVPCTAPTHGWERTKQAIQTILHYELAIIAAGIVLLVISWNAVNQIGLWTYLLLFAMRLSAKLNVFLGVRNLSEAFLPKHLGYLATYFSRRNMNPFFPVSLGASVVVMWLLVQALSTPGVTAFEFTAHSFVATLMGLAILEHIFMVIPLSLEPLWGWSMRSRKNNSIKPQTAKAAEAISIR